MPDKTSVDDAINEALIIKSIEAFLRRQSTQSQNNHSSDLATAVVFVYLKDVTKGKLT